jgi:hypothetical protein
MVKLAELRDRTKIVGPNINKTRAHKDLAKQRRKVRGLEKSKNIEHRAQSARPLPRPRKRVVVPFMTKLDGAKIISDLEKKKEVTEYFQELWRDLKKLKGEVPNWIYDKWNSAVLDEFPEITGALLRDMALKMRKGKTCSDDLVVMEMIQELDEKILDELAEIFKLRAINHGSEDMDGSWG